MPAIYAECVIGAHLLGQLAVWLISNNACSSVNASPTTHALTRGLEYGLFLLFLDRKAGTAVEELGGERQVEAPARGSGECMGTEWRKVMISYLRYCTDAVGGAVDEGAWTKPMTNGRQ